MRIGLVLLLAATLVACSEDEPAPSTRGANARGAQPAVGVTGGGSLPGPGEPTGRRRRAPSPPTPSARSGGAPAPSGGGVVVAHEEGREDPDAVLERALQRAFGTPLSCLSAETRDAAGSSLTVNVRVRVTSTGRVVDATVTGSQLSDADIDCMTTRAEGLSLPGPIERAPRTVATRIRYDVQDSRVTTSTRDFIEERELNDGTLRPDSTLEAAMTQDERPTGFVAPSSTLSGSDDVEPGPAPGYVAPGSTLPASAEDEAERNDR